LEKRLLEPLGGNSLSISQDESMATLHFEGPRTAQRAELICRAAASAAEKNLKGRGGQSLTTSRSGSPGETSDKSLSQGPESASRGMGLNLLIPQSGSGNSQGKSSLSNGTSPSGLGGFGKMPSSNEGQSGASPVFKPTPATPPTSYTNYLFESSGAFDGSLAFGALMMPTSSLAGPSMGLASLQFDQLHNEFSDHPLSTMGTSCVEVSSSSMLGGSTQQDISDMTSALIAPGTSMSGSQLAEDMEPMPPISLSLITSEAGGGSLGDLASVRSPLTALLSSALAPPASSPGVLPKSPKSPLLVTSPGTGPARGMSPLVDCSPPTSLNTSAAALKSPAEKKDTTDT